MRSLVLVILFSSLMGCAVPSLNSPKEPNKSGSDMRKCCGCAGMDSCGKNADGTTCCKPDDCRCKQVTQR